MTKQPDDRPDDATKAPDQATASDGDMSASEPAFVPDPAVKSPHRTGEAQARRNLEDEPPV